MAKAIIQQQVDELQAYRTYLEVFRKSLIGTIKTFVVKEVPDAFMICDGSLVLFEDWPEFKAAYDSGKFTGMVLDAADPAYVGKFVKNGETGLYLPDLESLFVQASAAGTAGSYVAPGLPNITGSFNIIAGVPSAQVNAQGAISCVDGTIYNNIAVGSSWQNRNNLISINAALSSAIYSDSINTVQPPTVQYVMAMYLGKPAAAA